MRAFQHARIRDLFRQLLRGPVHVRRRNAEKLQGLIAQLEPERLYPYEFVCFRVTGYRPKEDVREAYAGGALSGDLIQGLRMLTASAPLPADAAGEEVCTDREVARLHDVSLRTVRRWKCQGLPAAVYLFPDGRTAPGVRRSALEAFISQARGPRKRAPSLRRLTAAEQRRILGLARRLAGESRRLTPAAVRIARELGRAPETVRAFLVRHDRNHPEEAVFRRAQARLEDDAPDRILADYVRGIPVRELCTLYGRSRASIYRIINAGRAARILDAALSYRHGEDFAGPDASESLLGPEFHDALMRLEEGAHGLTALAGAVVERPLTKEDEAALFAAYNYLKWRMDGLRQGINCRRYVPSAILEEVEGLGELAGRIREGLNRAHLLLVEQVARLHATDAAGASRLAATGRALLARLVDAFDWQRRARFASYVRLELMKAFARGAR